MDTRIKIVAVADVPHGRPIIVISGYFDPLQAAHLPMLGNGRHGEARVVLVLEGDDPILPLRSRCELVAGIAAVDYVIPCDGAPDEVLAALQPVQVFRFEDRDAELTGSLRERVLRRHESR